MYTGNRYEECLREMLQYLDVLVDGEFILEQKRLGLAFRGSSNQRLIDVKESIKTGQVVLMNLKDR